MGTTRHSLSVERVQNRAEVMRSLGQLDLHRSDAHDYGGSLRSRGVLLPPRAHRHPLRVKASQLGLSKRCEMRLVRPAPHEPEQRLLGCVTVTLVEEVIQVQRALGLSLPLRWNPEGQAGPGANGEFAERPSGREPAPAERCPATASGPERLEEAARGDLGLIKPGETLITIRDRDRQNH